MMQPVVTHFDANAPAVRLESDAAAGTVVFQMIGMRNEAAEFHGVIPPRPLDKRFRHEPGILQPGIVRPDLQSRKRKRRQQQEQSEHRHFFASRK